MMHWLVMLSTDAPIDQIAPSWVWVMLCAEAAVILAETTAIVTLFYMLLAAHRKATDTAIENGQHFERFAVSSLEITKNNTAAMEALKVSVDSLKARR